jgi:hypothetical protein
MAVEHLHRAPVDLRLPVLGVFGVVPLRWF